MVEVKPMKLADSMTIEDAFKWLTLGYELICNNGDISGIVKREEPHVVEA